MDKRLFLAVHLASTTFNKEYLDLYKSSGRLMGRGFEVFLTF